MVKSNYIPVIQQNYDMFTNLPHSYFVPARKIQINNIKIDRSLMSYPNEVSQEQVETIIEYFDEFAWLPIIINKQHFLLDGQHRLEVARRLKLRYIDAIIEDEDLITYG